MNNPIRHGQDMMIHIADALDEADKMPNSRALSLVKTKLDEAIMWGNRTLCELSEAVNQDDSKPQ